MKCLATTLMFSDPKDVTAALETLLHSGISHSQIAIHRWGEGIGVRVFADIGDALLEELAQIGARSFSAHDTDPLIPTGDGAPVRRMRAFAS